MLFLWSKEPPSGPRGSPWFAWFATAQLLWHCRRSVAKAILAVSPLRLLKKRGGPPSAHTKSLSTDMLVKHHHHLRLDNPILQRKHRHLGIRSKMKRMGTGDGPHVTNSVFISQSQQVHYKVTRSGRIYGKYLSKAVA